MRLLQWQEQRRRNHTPLALAYSTQDHRYPSQNPHTEQHAILLFVQATQRWPRRGRFPRTNKSEPRNANFGVEQKTHE